MSMLPTLAPGDLVVLDRRGRVQPGRIVVAVLPDGTVAVKRAVLRDGSQWWLERDNPSVGVDSWTVGAVPDQQVLGVVRARVWPRPARLRA
jgi:SOS-response transcriptional repressor LexA